MSRSARNLRLDPDPLEVAPEPVRRRRPPVIDQERSGMVIVWVSLAALVLIAMAALVAAPRSGPDPTAPQPGVSDAAGFVRASALTPASASGGSQSGAPHGTSRTIPRTAKALDADAADSDDDDDS